MAVDYLSLLTAAWESDYCYHTTTTTTAVRPPSHLLPQRRRELHPVLQQDESRGAHVCDRGEHEGWSFWRFRYVSVDLGQPGLCPSARACGRESVRRACGCVFGASALSPLMLYRCAAYVIQQYWYDMIVIAAICPLENNSRLTAVWYRGKPRSL